MNITIQNTLLAGQRTGRTIVAADDDGAEMAMLNVAVEQNAETTTLAVEHSAPRWPDSLGKAATAPTEQLAAQQLIESLLGALETKKPA